jgi:hypothetical protein
MINMQPYTLTREEAKDRLKAISLLLNELHKDIERAGLPRIIIYGNDGNSNCARIEETHYDGVNLVWYASEYCSW